MRNIYATIDDEKNSRTMSDGSNLYSKTSEEITDRKTLVDVAQCRGLIHFYGHWSPTRLKSMIVLKGFLEGHLFPIEEKQQIPIGARGIACQI